jgi:hypothetical protein
VPGKRDGRRVQTAAILEPGKSQVDKTYFFPGVLVLTWKVFPQENTFFFFLVVLGFELRVLLGKHSTT